MQPFVHAQASSARGGRHWEDDLSIHEFMDLAKHACPDLRHRLLLHNADLGPQLAELAFPHRPDAADIARSHVEQDLGWLPPLSVWLDHCDSSKLPRVSTSQATAAEIVRSAAMHFDLDDASPIQQIWSLLNLAIPLAPGKEEIASLLVMSSMGPILARSVFGPPRRFRRKNGSEAIVDFGWVAEGMIVARMGTIHSLERVLACFDGREPCRNNSGAI